jgi:hypothetical protein
MRRDILRGTGPAVVHNLFGPDKSIDQVIRIKNVPFQS